MYGNQKTWSLSKMLCVLGELNRAVEFLVSLHLFPTDAGGISLCPAIPVGLEEDVLLSCLH